MTQLAFIDIETTGLNPRQHQVWEVGLILTGDIPGMETEHVWQLDVSMEGADPNALAINGFYDRYKGDLTHRRHMNGSGAFSPDDFADEFTRLVKGRHLVGAGVAFDARFLERLLRLNNQIAMWHYHLIDVEAMMLGYLAAKGVEVPLPWKSADLAAAVGVDGTLFEKHTALGDARWAKAIYDTITVSGGG